MYTHANWPKDNEYCHVKVNFRGWHFKLNITKRLYVISSLILRKLAHTFMMSHFVFNSCLFNMAKTVVITSNANINLISA